MGLGLGVAALARLGHREIVGEGAFQRLELAVVGGAAIERAGALVRDRRLRRLGRLGGLEFLRLPGAGTGISGVAKWSTAHALPVVSSKNRPARTKLLTLSAIGFPP